MFQRLDALEYRSGEALASDLGVTRAAVWKAVEQLRALGLELEAVPHRGYRLTPGVNALSAERISELLPAAAAPLVHSLSVEWLLESTNTHLLAMPPPPAGSAHVVLAENQTAGRGRRGRQWIAPPGGAVCLSIGWSYGDMPADLSAISLVTGVCVREALLSFGAAGVHLKWPNDLITPDGKLGGILIELRAESAGPAYVVVGIGLNVQLDGAARAAVLASGAQADDLRTRCQTLPDRDHLVAAILERLLPALAAFPRQGFTPTLAQWHAADALFGVEVRVEIGEQSTRGIARGVDAHGALLLETPTGVQRFVSGEVSVRVAR